MRKVPGKASVDLHVPLADYEVFSLARVLLMPSSKT